MEKSEKQTKYIFVTGGVASSLGKGIIAASLAKLLQARGYSVTNQKCDPYINVDPGTLSPYEHGECYVTEDGAVTDLDLGHYERFTGTPTSQANGVTTGRIYQNVINKERSGQYQGKTVQVVPHITDEIKRSILKLGKQGKYDIIITEIGGFPGWKLFSALCLNISELSPTPNTKAPTSKAMQPPKHKRIQRKAARKAARKRRAAFFLYRNCFL